VALASDPDSLYAEFLSKDVLIHQELGNTSDGLRAFEITDNDGTRRLCLEIWDFNHQSLH